MDIQQPTLHARAAGQASNGEVAGHTANGAAADVPHLTSAKILGASGEAVIEHEGHLYRLRRTSRGGLVLTK